MKTYYSGIFLLLFLASQAINGQICRDVEIETTPISTVPDCNRSDGSIVLANTRGGTPPYSYQIDTTTSQIGAFFDLGVGIYDIIISDAIGCRDTLRVDLTYRELGQIVKPYNAFTPNGDDINDTWVINGIESFQSSEVNIYNRWGQQVHLASPYDNDAGWDGKQTGGSELPAGTYFYVISVFNNCQEEFLNGTVNIIR